MGEVVIVDGCRTAVARKKGMFVNVRPDDLAGIVLEELVNRCMIANREIEDVILGCVTQSGEQGGNIARTASLIAGFPCEVPGVTIDRQCGSSQQAVHFAAQAIASGDMDTVIAGGVESMTRVPMFSQMKGIQPSQKLTDRYQIVNQGISAEMIADKWQLSREKMDSFALSSHEKALMAVEEGRFKDEIVPVLMNDGSEKGSIDMDQGPRTDTSMEKLASLPPVFIENGKITAGNASQMSDGASALLLMAKEKAEELGLKPKAKIIARSVVGSDPTLMLTGPMAATNKVLKKAEMTLDMIDRFEVNEAFATVPLAWLAETGADSSKLNVNGGAIALGHPLGATGGKLLISLMNELRRANKKYGLLAICEGMGMANATIIENLHY